MISRYIQNWIEHRRLNREDKDKKDSEIEAVKSSYRIWLINVSCSYVDESDNPDYHNANIRGLMNRKCELAELISDWRLTQNEMHELLMLDEFCCRFYDFYVEAVRVNEVRKAFEDPGL